MAAEDLQKVADQLDGEAREDAQLREQYGSKWNRPASQALNSTMREKIAGQGCVHRTGPQVPAVRLCAQGRAQKHRSSWPSRPCCDRALPFEASGPTLCQATQSVRRLQPVDCSGGPWLLCG